MLQGDADGVRAEVQDRIAVWTLARPDRHNALTMAMLERLADLARAAGASRDIRAVIIAGAGERAFCAGADLKERQGMSQQQVRGFLARIGATLDAIDRLDKPVVAALHGVALGGGLELALACDLRVMTPDAQVGLTETALGIIPGAGGTQRLPRLIGVARAKQMILLAERIDAPEALRIGLVQRVAKPGQPALDCALELAAPFRRAAPIALAAALEALDASLELDLADGLARERACYERPLASQDRLEALAAFAEKRAPVFRGE